MKSSNSAAAYSAAEEEAREKDGEASPAKRKLATLLHAHSAAKYYALFAAAWRAISLRSVEISSGTQWRTMRRTRLARTPSEGGGGTPLDSLRAHHRASTAVHLGALSVEGCGAIRDISFRKARGSREARRRSRAGALCARRLTLGEHLYSAPHGAHSKYSSISRSRRREISSSLSKSGSQSWRRKIHIIFRITAFLMRGSFAYALVCWRLWKCQRGSRILASHSPQAAAVAHHALNAEAPAAIYLVAKYKLVAHGVAKHRLPDACAAANISAGKLVYGSRSANSAYQATREETRLS